MTAQPQLKVYVAGKMTGIPHYNVAEFHRVADIWRAKGYSVTTPFDTNSIVWRRHFGRPFNPFADTCEYGDPKLAEMFAEDIRAALEADIIVLLDSWQNSKGATREVPVAHLFGKQFRDEHGRIVHITPTITFEVFTMPDTNAA